jgi:hypothetical protein
VQALLAALGDVAHQNQPVVGQFAKSDHCL